ncbi:TPA: hypothetical protein DIS55_03900 [Candidatus Kaiserbacteria bacterium]|uniref:Rossmann fold nucleotide-binding protein n=2 Tax=Parcubacteria group TaxID=1794811 RepID=A0A0G1M8Z8_9BACT|nr:MAG: hypothetical protein UX06_C0009G0005 [Candidatus Giovannonibacteria bacterium GW2011_GWA2_45_21]OGG87948.1 MAG: hypothetical protein A3H15_01255 [Candidatus Kaiserbacteria bacterium RIFCSPLOWO2_12_FULL_50_28]HCM44061.1 hypothetical protein [Candidatus Kaiserbacteria bacterium]
MNTIKSVSFFGCACGNVGDTHVEAAREVAKLVAKSGRRVVNGGGPGVMLAATEGAKEAGGRTVAVYYRPELTTSFVGEIAANHADERFEEANYVLRTKKLLELSDINIIFNGGTGTISEFGMAWGLARLYFGHHKPLILYGDFWKPIMDSFKNNMLVRPEEYEVFTIVSSPKDALEAIEKYEGVLTKNRHEHINCNSSECYLLL